MTFSPPTRASYRQLAPLFRSIYTYEQYVESHRAWHEQAEQHARDVAAAAAEIRRLLAREPHTEGRLVGRLTMRHPGPRYSADVVREALGGLVGSRLGARTTGDAVIAGYCGGSELYGLREGA